jgi:YHS domain-containing protein
MENSIALKDPVCGMAVTNKSFHQSEHMGHLFYFCGAKCKARFVANAPRYSGESAVVAGVAVPADTAVPPPGARWHRGWLLVPAVLLALVLAGLWLA